MENNSHTPMFIPIPDNPLHLDSRSLFLSSPSPPLISTSLQRKSLKEAVKHSVRWSSPLSMSKEIPSRELNAPIQKTWSISQSLMLNESQCENTTLLELDHQFSHSLQKGKSGPSGSILSFSRPKSLLAQAEEVQARMNLMHLHKVVPPKILSPVSISRHFNSTFPSRPKHPFSKAPRSHTTGRHDAVFKLATTINIPKQSRLDSPPASVPRKRRSVLNKHPRKAPRTDENTLATSSRESEADELDSPSLSAADDPYTSTVERFASEPPSSGNDSYDDDDDDDASVSDGQSPFGDHEFSEREEPARNDVTASTRRSQSDNQIQRFARRPLNSIRVVTWTNGLKRFDYLLQNNKMDWRCEDELYELLKVMDVEKDNMTIELLKKTHVGKIVKDLSKCDRFEERSRELAKGIYRSWLKMCRAVE